MIVSTFRFHCYMLHKIIGDYTLTSHRICGFWVESMESMSSPWAVHGNPGGTVKYRMSFKSITSKKTRDIAPAKVPSGVNLNLFAPSTEWFHRLPVRIKMPKNAKSTIAVLCCMRHGYNIADNTCLDYFQSHISWKLHLLLVFKLHSPTMVPVS